MNATTTKTPALYGLIAEFSTPGQLLNAANRTREAGYTRIDAYTPFPIHGLSDAIGFEDSKIPWIVFIGGVLGFCVGLGLQYVTSVIDYPMNVGGRPFFSWPSFMPVTFECTVLFAAFGAVLGMLGLNGLPRPYHSIFNAPRFEQASQDRFFLCIEAEDPKFDREATERFLRGFDPDAVEEVEP